MEFQIDVPAGTYDVSVYAGLGGSGHTPTIKVNGKDTPYTLLTTTILSPEIKFEAGIADKYDITIEWDGEKINRDMISVNVANGSQFRLNIPYKSGKAGDEIKEAGNAVRLLAGKVEDTVSFMIPNTDMDRTLVLIKKTAPIHRKYPRKAGTPQKEPLK